MVELFGKIVYIRAMKQLTGELDGLVVVGFIVGLPLGEAEGLEVGERTGELDGLVVVGFIVGPPLGEAEGLVVGDRLVGDDVGAEVYTHSDDGVSESLVKRDY